LFGRGEEGPCVEIGEIKQANSANSERRVTERREWLANAFKRRETESHSHTETQIQHGLVHDRLQWIADEKRKSLSQTRPDNKDASENIPPHLVEGRKKWLDEQMRNMTLQQQRVFLARISKQLSRSVPDEGEEHPDEPPRLRPKSLSPSISSSSSLNNSSVSVTSPGASVDYGPCKPRDTNQGSIEKPRKRQYYALPPNSYTNHSQSPLSVHSLADYARQSAQTMARAKLPVAPFFDEELIFDANSPFSRQSMLLSPMSMASPRSSSPAKQSRMIVVSQDTANKETRQGVAKLATAFPPKAPEKALQAATTKTEPTTTKCACCIM
jgi:hypothetical protein